MDASIDCSKCSHYHDFGDLLQCDKGIMEVRMIGKPQVIVTMKKCGFADIKNVVFFPLESDSVPVEVTIPTLGQAPKKRGPKPKNG